MSISSSYSDFTTPVSLDTKISSLLPLLVRLTVQLDSETGFLLSLKSTSFWHTVESNPKRRIEDFPSVICPSKNEHVLNRFIADNTRRNLGRTKITEILR